MALKQRHETTAVHEVDGHKRHKDVLNTNKGHGQLLKTGNNRI